LQASELLKRSSKEPRGERSSSRPSDAPKLTWHVLSGKAESPATDEELRLEVSRTLTTLLTDRLGGNFPWPGISWCSDTDRVLCRADEFAALFFDSKPQSKAGPGHRRARKPS